MRLPHSIHPSAPITIFAVVVIYRIAPLKSSSVITLLAAAHAAELAGIRVHLRIADNTPGGQPVETLPNNLEYSAYPINPGLAEPYNHALHDAVARGFDWLLTLDQDTHLPSDFLVRMADEARKCMGELKVAAIVPHMADGDRAISPMCYRARFLPVVLPVDAHGLAPRHTSAINSGSLLRCSALLSVDGYDPEFPLHNSDTRLFQKLDDAGYRVSIAALTVPHELSILNRQERIRPERYRRMLEDECAFWDRRMNVAARAERILRLAGRVIRSRLTNEAREFVSITQNELRRRLFTSRTQRMKRFSEEHRSLR